MADGNSWPGQKRLRSKSDCWCNSDKPFFFLCYFVTSYVFTSQFFFCPAGSSKENCVMMERSGTFQSYDSSGQLACLVLVNGRVLKLCSGHCFM